MSRIIIYKPTFVLPEIPPECPIASDQPTTTASVCSPISTLSGFDDIRLDFDPYLPKLDEFFSIPFSMDESTMDICSPISSNEESQPPFSTESKSDPDHGLNKKDLNLTLIPDTADAARNSLGKILLNCVIEGKDISKEIGRLDIRTTDPSNFVATTIKKHVQNTLDALLAEEIDILFTKIDKQEFRDFSSRLNMIIEKAQKRISKAKKDSAFRLCKFNRLAELAVLCIKRKEAQIQKHYYATTQKLGKILNSKGILCRAATAKAKGVFNDGLDSLLNQFKIQLNCCENEAARNQEIKTQTGRFQRDYVHFLENWYKQNIQHPYPTNNEKLELANLTGLTEKQICCWLANKRSRKGFEVDMKEKKEIRKLNS